MIFLVAFWKLHKINISLFLLQHSRMNLTKPVKNTSESYFIPKKWFCIKKTNYFYSEISVHYSTWELRNKIY